MFILFKRYGRMRNFKKYNSISELKEEINKGHNPEFPGNNQFSFQVETREIEVLNGRISVAMCLEDIEASDCLLS